jgi:hypothetical protein
MSPGLPAASSIRAALIAVAVLGLLLLAMVALGTGDEKKDTTSDLRNGFHALSADEFSTAMLDAQREAGSWRYQEVTSQDGAAGQVWEGEQVWDGTTTTLRYGAKDESGDYVLEARLVAGEFYLRASNTKGAKPWWKLDKVRGESSDALVQSMSKDSDPVRRAAIFADPAAFKVIGVEDIESGPAVHYRVEVAAEAVRKATGVPVPGEAGKNRLFEVWLDKEDRLVKLVSPVDVAGLKLSETITFSDYGADLTITAPPADQITTAVPKLTP